MSYNFFGLKFDFDPVAFTIPGTNWGIRWYGVLITIGFILALIYGMKRSKFFAIDPERLFDCVLITTPLAILGARAYYIAFDSTITFKQFFEFRNGGLAIYGAVLVAIIVGTLSCLIRKVNILSALDLMSLGFLLAQSVGRWGNFINQEAYGTFTGSNWFGISGTKIVGELDSTQLVHPCFLYESLWCILGFVILHFISKKRKFNGQIVASYLVWYGLGRFFIEYLRTYSLFKGTVKVSMLLSGVMVIVGVILLAVGTSISKNNEQQYVPVYDEVDGETFIDDDDEIDFEEDSIDMLDDFDDDDDEGEE